MVTRVLIVLVVVAAPASAAWACLWVDGTTIDGQRVTRGWEARRLREMMNLPPDSRGAAIRFGLLDRSEPSTAGRRESEAVKAILEGRPGQAVELFESVEADSPGLYSTAANLGTAYELAGDDAAALRWIRTAIERNPDAHHGTEWLHEFILEIKIRLLQEPDLLTRERLISLPARFSLTDRVEISGQSFPVAELWEALSYQLGERMLFVKPEDLVVADLLFALGQIEANLRLVEEGIELLGLAQEYGFADPQLLEETLSNYRSIVRRGDIMEGIRWTLRGIGAIGIICLLLHLRDRLRS